MFQEMHQTWNDAERQSFQAWRFDGLAKRLRQDNRLFREAWKGIPEARLRYDHLGNLPFTLKAELLDDQRRNPPFGSNLTFPLSRYVRFHQTSGTSGTPLRVLDTAQSWNWWSTCWQAILDAAEVTQDDRVMLAFSFGPFIGFWAAQEAVQQYGALVLPGGGMTSAQRLAMMRDLEATVLVCTPSYALHLAEVARQEGIDPARDLKVRITIHAGEPGAGIPATRERIESLWGARTYDHPGASEVGAFGFSCSARRGVHVNEAEFICEVLDPETGRAVEPGAPGELVLTNLGRDGFPVVRYRTGDIVKPLPRHTCSCGRTLLLLEGGILGRRDDMVTIRGINVFPSAFLAIFNSVQDVGEHRVTAYRVSHMDQIHVEYEDLGGVERREDLQRLIREKLGIRVSLQPCAPGSLPRFEAKAKRFVDRRQDGWRPEGQPAQGKARMQLGLMAKLIGRPVEVRGLPVTMRYASNTLRWEAGKSAFGAAVCFGMIVGLTPSPWVAVPLGLVGLLFSAYGLQQVRRGGVSYEVNETAVTRIQGSRRVTIRWDQLESFRLHFYAFGRKAQEGTLEVRLTHGGQKLKADSSVDDFATLLVHASRVARDRDLTLDPTTVANLEQLGL